MKSLAERVIEVSEHLQKASLSYAFGGALALAFHVEQPRGTTDIDINVFINPSEMEQLFHAIEDLVEITENNRKQLKRDAQTRFFLDELTPLDVFLRDDPFHDDAELGVISVPFEGRIIPILAALHLCVFKVVFNRTKDWADIEAMLEANTIDIPRAIGWVNQILGDDERTTKLRITALRASV